LERFRTEENLTWRDPWLEAQDLEYHHLDPSRSLGLALADLDGPWAKGLDDMDALSTPPANTRAVIRSRVMRRIAQSRESYEIDWHRIESSGEDPVILLDPFATRSR
jgi:proteasome accessory factor A